MTIDERIEALLKASEKHSETMDRLEAGAIRQSETMDRIQKGLDTELAYFREFREDRWHINQSLRVLTEKMDRLTDNVNKLESLFTRSLTKPPNGKTKK